MIDSLLLEGRISVLLDDFYKRRSDKIIGLKLKDTLKRKNPYLYRAIGIQSAADIVSGLLSAYMSSSDEGIFGDSFFEPLAKFVSGGVVSPSEGVDVAVETDTKYMAIAVKSGPSVFNAQSKRRQAEDFKALENRLRKLQKHFDAVVGYSYGKKKQRCDSNAQFRELAGQAFWTEITGDDDFYLKIIRLMKDKPQKHLLEYEAAWNAALNRFTKEFIDEFCLEDGFIDWEKLTRFNSGM
jgi:Type II restriction endonuclease EcoO109I